MIALYLRVSTADNQSVASQRPALEAWLAQHQGPAEWYEDSGFTGANTDRPALARLMADVDSGKVKTVVVWKMDRLSRSQFDFISLMRRFEAKGVGFVSVTQPIDTTTAMGRAFMGILAVFAELERENIRERVTAGVRASISNGKRWGYANPAHKQHRVVDRERIRSLRESGMKPKEVAEACGVSVRTVYNVKA